MTISHKRMKVLVVGDSFERLNELFRTLESGWFEVLFALGGNAGLRAAGLERPDAILCELGLHDMPGIEFCHSIRKNPLLENTSFAFLAKSFHNRQNIADAISAGADDCLCERTESEHLIAKVYLMIERKRHEVNLREQYEILRSRQVQIAGIVKMAARLSSAGRSTNLPEGDLALRGDQDTEPDALFGENPISANMIDSLANLLDEQVRAFDQWESAMHIAQPAPIKPAMDSNFNTQSEFVM